MHFTGFVWQEQLIFKGKFQVDQAKDSVGRPSVPDVTAIAMSKYDNFYYACLEFVLPQPGIPGFYSRNYLTADLFTRHINYL